MKKHRPVVQFYADNLIHRNKLYTYFVNNLQDARNCYLRHAAKGWHIRCAFYKEYNANGQLRSNTQIYSCKTGIA
jgi:hypothetical protein